MPKPKNKYDREHLHNLDVYQEYIDAIYAEAVKEAASIGVSLDDVDISKPFTFDDYPRTRKRVNALLEQLRSQLQMSIVNAVRSEWTLSNNKNNELCNVVFGNNVGKLSEEQYRRYYSTNEKALEAFIKRKERGLNLSDRVWNYSNTFKREMEMGLDLGIREGLDAPTMARDLKQYLRHPDKLFRRVRDEHGNLHLSKAAADFHPGRGVYRSSYLNARRLAATETNIAYRTADHERWQRMDFVVGIEIHLSNNHNCKGFKPGTFHDICDQLKGKYPKDFKFTGWHPHCRCYATTILKTDDEIEADTQKILRGEPLDGESVNKVEDVPEGFKEWEKKNEERMKAAKEAGTLPRFVRENEELVKVKLVVQGDKSEKPKLNTAEGTNKVRGNTEPLQSPDISKKSSITPPDLVTSEEANKIVECEAHSKIMDIQTYEKLEEYVTKNGIATKIDLSTMPIEMAREACATWAQIQHDWNLPPIELKADKMEDKNFGFGNGGWIRINKKTFGDNAKKNIQVEFKKSVTEFIDGRKKVIEKWRKKSNAYNEWINNAKKRGDEVTADIYQREKNKLDKSIQKEEDIIEKHSRHNVFLSEKSVLRNMVQHESGHVVDDRLLGSINGEVFQLKDRLTADEVKQMNEGIMALFKKYKNNCGWLSTYGMKKRNEFLSECMVLYSEKGGEGLPKDVKDWFDKLKAMSLRKKS